MGAGRQENNNWHSVQIWKLYLLHLIHKLPNTALLYIPLALFRLIHLDGLSIYTEFGFSCFFFSFNTDLLSSYCISAVWRPSSEQNRSQIFAILWGETDKTHMSHFHWPTVAVPCKKELCSLRASFIRTDPCAFGIQFFLLEKEDDWGSSHPWHLETQTALKGE